jgi:DNA (cytosine-5)-methyltransferase 1
LQSFPIDYVFEGTYDDVERQIGNACPPRLAQGIGSLIASLIGISGKPAAMSAVRDPGRRDFSGRRQSP